jgi:hypothetical protein
MVLATNALGLATGAMFIEAVLQAHCQQRQKVDPIHMFLQNAE